MNNFKYSFLLWILSISFVFAQQTVTGLVTDDQGFPLPGATILEVGTSNGTTTDFDGNFTIEVGDDAFVSISYVGYQTLTLASNADFSKISLSSSNALDEVVVTSFGVTREKKSLGYSQQSVGGDQLVKARETVREVYMDEKIEQYIVDIVFATRNPEQYGLKNLKELIQSTLQIFN